MAPLTAVQYPSDGAALRALWTETPGRPSVLLLHDWWGLNDFTQQSAARLSQAGFSVLVPDLYGRQGGQATTDPAQAGKWLAAFSSQQVLRDLNAAVRFLKQQPGAAERGIGVLGLGLGGTLVLSQACHNSEIRAAVAFAGKPPLTEITRYLLAPVQYHIGGKDEATPKAEVDGFRDTLGKTGKPADIRVYPDAGRWFFDPSQPAGYRQADAEAAWAASIAFLQSWMR